MNSNFNSTSTQTVQNKGRNLLVHMKVNMFHAHFSTAVILLSLQIISINASPCVKRVSLRNLCHDKVLKLIVLA